MEQEQEFSLDLGRWFGALRRWYRLILLTTLLSGGVALLVSFLLPRTYEAEAVVAIVRSASTVSFDPKFTTVSNLNSTNTAIVDQAAQRTALTTLVKNPDIANAVIAKVGAQLFETPPDPTTLADGLDVVNNGDLIRIKATGKTPENAALLANTWAQEYAARINSVYGENTLSSSDLGTQANTTKKDYDTKEAALIAYLATNPTDKIARQIAEKQQILAALQSGKDTAIKTVVDKEIEARAQIISEYLNAEAQDRVIAFTKEQEGKNKLLGSYLDAVINSRLAVFNQQATDKIQKLSDLYSIANKLDRLLADANALRSRLGSGSAAPRGDELAGILLESSAFSTYAALPVSLQIPIDQLSVGTSVAEQTKSLDTLIAALTDRRKSVQSDIEAQSKDLLSNSGYTFLDAGVFGQDSVIDAVKKQYPELFTIGDLAALTDATGTNDPLAQSADEKSKALVQLQGLEKVIVYSTTDQPITQAMDQLNAEMNQLQSQLEQESAKKQELVRSRDLAWSTYTTLANKVAEVGIAPPGSVVRLATPAVPPLSPSAPKKATNTLIGLAVGLLLGVAVALGFEFMNNTIHTEAQATQRLALPVIGAIPETSMSPKPKVKTGGNGNETRGALDFTTLDPWSPATEAFRVLQHNLFNGEVTWQALAVASATPAEGKSSIAANLAVLTARAGKRVVLVDADFRRASQHRLFGLKNANGLYDILSGAIDRWQTYAQTTTVDGLRVVTSGPLPHDPAMLIESPELGRWIEMLKQTVDVIILDMPPTLGLVDAMAIVHVADAILFVVGADLVNEADAVRAKELLIATGVPVLGVVLNRAEVVPGALTYAYYHARQADIPPSPESLTRRQPSRGRWLGRVADLIVPRKRG